MINIGTTFLFERFKMLKTGKKTLMLGIVSSIVFFFSAFQMNPLIQLIVMLCVFVFVLTLIINFLSIPFRWKSQGKWAVLPFGFSVLSIMFFLFTLGLGFEVKMLKFRSQKPEYEQVIDLIKQGNIPIRKELDRLKIPDRFDHLAYSVMGTRDDNGVITVEFLTEGGFPVKHSGFLYRSDGQPKKWERIDRWPIYGEIETNWYRISD